MAIDHEDNILVWGENWNGQLGIGNYNRQLIPTKAIINNLNEFNLSEEHLKNIHEEASYALGLELEEKQNIEHVNQSIFNVMMEFTKYNKKFILSFLLNILLISVILRYRRQLIE